MADFGGDAEAFRLEARAWLDENFPKALRDNPAAQMAAMMGAAETAEVKTWRERIGKQGWGTPTWPKAYGGGGLSRPEARVLAEEMNRIGARNPIGGMGVSMFGPTLLEYGTEEQKQKHIPAICRGETRWCQGYSEPGAGSDLAGLQTKCEDKGDHWLINGQKIWTSYANRADWCFCLVRTDPNAEKHQGISFVLIDMASPGVETRPIQLISGESPFCETFFTDVKIPKENLVGELNKGWEIAKRLLQYERQNISGGFGGGGGSGGAAGDLGDLAKRYVGVDEAGALADADLRGRITRNKMDFQAFGLTLSRINAESRSSNGPSAATSIIKYAAAAFAQERSELMVEAMGAQGLGWEGATFTPGEITATRGWLRAKANSIEGGTSEVNLNVVSKRVLGLPDPKPPK